MNGHERMWDISMTKMNYVNFVGTLSTTNFHKASRIKHLYIK